MIFLFQLSYIAKKDGNKIKIKIPKIQQSFGCWQSFGIGNLKVSFDEHDEDNIFMILFSILLQLLSNLVIKDISKNITFNCNAINTVK